MLFNTKVFFFHANDLMHYFSSPNWQTLFVIFNKYVQKVTQSLQTNKLKFNTGRSNYIVFGREKNPVEEALNF